jgi:hypothetical protein
MHKEQVMKRNLSLGGGFIAAAILLTGSSAEAHIKMLKPASWLKENAQGAPQKGGPCGPGNSSLPFGDDVQPVPLSGAITTFTAGQKIKVEWEETIQHPGYFRIALAENRADLKDPTHAIDGSCNVKDRSQIQTGAHDNVLADGILIQPKGGPARPGFPNFSYEVTLPNKPCEKCTLQLIQFMENHPPGCIYYHCADIKIVGAGGDAGVANDAGAQDGGVTVGSDAGTPGAGGGLTGGGSTTGGGGAAGGAAGGGATTGNVPNGGGAAGGAAGTGGTAGGGAGTGGAATGGGSTGIASTAGGATAGGAPLARTGAEDDDGGCSVAFGEGQVPGAAAWATSVVSLSLMIRRRRRGQK